MARYDLSYAEHEDKKARKQWDVEFGTRMTRFYTLSTASATSLKPARGALLTGESGLTGIRVMSALLPEPRDGVTRMKLELIQPVAYASASSTDFQELRGSRREVTGEKMRTMVRWGVSANLQDLPDEGDNAPGAGAAVTELRCTEVDKNDKDTVPGLYFIRLTYKAYEPYLKRLAVTGTLNPDVTGFYTENGVYAGNPAYTDGTYWLWRYGSTAWIISTAKGTTANAWTASGLISDSYAPTGTSTGTATVAISRDTSHFMEIKGSRQLRTLRGQRVATRLGITDDGTGAWAEGDSYPSESGLTGLVCRQLDSDIPSGIRGLTLTRAHYHAFQAYATS